MKKVLDTRQNFIKFKDVSNDKIYIGTKYDTSGTRVVFIVENSGPFSPKYTLLDLIECEKDKVSLHGINFDHQTEAIEFLFKHNYTIYEFKSIAEAVKHAYTFFSPATEDCDECGYTVSHEVDYCSQCGNWVPYDDSSA